MSFPRYPKYKDSGVEWLGQVPEHWQLKKIGNISSLKGRLGWQGLKADEYRDTGPHVVSSAHFDANKIQWEECPRVSRERYDADGNIQLAANDVLLMKDGAAMGKLAFVDSLPGPACLNSHLLLFRPLKIENVETYAPRFVFYFMQTGYFQEHIRVNGTGATFLGISQEAISRYQIVLPPVVEQARIAEFLDQETAKIDALVEEQERLMALLKEKRQAVISHAVTKGLNPKDPLKPSGIEWLGDVPTHWRTGRLAYLVDRLVDGTHFSPPNWPEGDFKYITAKNIKEHGFDFTELTFVTAEDHSNIYPRCPVRRGDVLYIKDGATAGIAMINSMDEQFSMLSSVALIRPNQTVLKPKFVSYHLNASQFKDDAIKQLVGGAMTRFTIDMIKRFIFAIPPIEEQESIAVFLDDETVKFDTLIAEAKRAVELLQERRTALISAAVTGQIDVSQATS